MALHNKVGIWGEKVALEYFIKNGYAIISKNDREGTKGNELDLIVSKGNRIIFVETKTRSNDYNDPIYSIDKKKRANLLRAGIAYLNSHPSPLEPQWDLFFINGNENEYRIEHLKDVFLPPLLSYGTKGVRMNL